MSDEDRKSDPEPLIDSRELGRRLSLSTSSVTRMASRAEIPALRVGSVWRFDWSEIVVWLEERRNDREAK